MRLLQAFAAIAAISLVPSCGKDPRSVKIPVNPKDWTESKEFLNAVESLQQHERSQVADYLSLIQNRKFYTGPGTLGELLIELNERARISEAKEKESREIQDKMNRILNAKVTSGRVRIEKSHYVAYLNINFHNLANTDILQLRGVVTIWDKFGRAIPGFGWRETNFLPWKPTNAIELFLDFEIPHGSTRNISLTVISYDKSVPIESVDDITMQWTPLTLLFRDGTSLEHRMSTFRGGLDSLTIKEPKE